MSIAPTHVPMGRVWAFLSKPGNFALWWDGKTQSIEPQGEAQPGQRIDATSALLGIPHDANVLVQRADERLTRST